jgi:hypothetical protein
MRTCVKFRKNVWVAMRRNLKEILFPKTKRQEAPANDESNNDKTLRQTYSG